MCSIHVCPFCQKQLCCVGEDWTTCAHCAVMVCYDCATEVWPESDVYRCSDHVSEDKYEVIRAYRQPDSVWVEIFWAAGYGVDPETGRTFYYAKLEYDHNLDESNPQNYATGPESILNEEIQSGNLVVTLDPPEDECGVCGKALTIVEVASGTRQHVCKLCGWKSDCYEA